MDTTAKYYDRRAEFFKAYFDKGLDYSAYLSTGTPNHKRKWDDFSTKIELSVEQRQLLAAFNRQMKILVMSGIWCGDCARQGPLIQALQEASSVIETRFIDNRENPELQDELRILGAMRVPVILVLSEDFFEVTRFGDRTLASYRRKAQTELGPACDAGLLPAGDSELRAEAQDWVEIFERCQLMLRLAPMLRERYQD